ncbi:MAG: hypothetical protein ACYDD1_03860 [Caulobacteraceae bacterium]
MPGRSPVEEIAALWRAVFGEPPPIRASVAVLTRHLVDNLPEAPPYQAFARSKPQPLLRPTFPEQPTSRHNRHLIGTQVDLRCRDAA